MTPLLQQARIVQNAYVVPDLEQACRQMHQLYGIGPFVGGQPAELRAHAYRGQPAPAIRFRSVFVQSGELNVELVQVLSPGPSAFHDMFGADQQGLHHVAVFCTDYARERDAFVQAGYPVASEFTAGVGAQICYVDTRPVLGHMIELYPEHPAIRAKYQQARDAAAHWDGQTLIIPWATGAGGQ
jgi:hypothetical protein